MLRKYFSIVIIPRRTANVKKIKIPLFIFGVAGLLLIGLISGIVYMTFDYLQLRSQLAGMEELERLKSSQEKKIEEFNEMYQELQLHFNNLTALNDKLKAMVITTVDSERKTKTRLKEAERLKANLEIAKKTSVLETIASDSSEFDSDLLYERDERYANLLIFYKTKKNPFVKVPNGMPVRGFLTDEFGMNTDPYTGQVRPQNGIDIASRLDYPVVATADGIVLELKQDEDLGNVLVIDHGNGFITKYGHLNRFDLDIGNIVKKGNVIAQVGNSGRTSGPRLYYEVLFNSVPQNPIKYMNN